MWQLLVDDKFQTQGHIAMTHLRVQAESDSKSMPSHYSKLNFSSKSNVLFPRRSQCMSYAWYQLQRIKTYQTIISFPVDLKALRVSQCGCWMTLSIIIIEREENSAGNLCLLLLWMNSLWLDFQVKQRQTDSLPGLRPCQWRSPYFHMREWHSYLQIWTCENSAEDNSRLGTPLHHPIHSVRCHSFGTSGWAGVSIREGPSFPVLYSILPLNMAGHGSQVAIENFNCN